MVDSDDFDAVSIGCAHIPVRMYDGFLTALVVWSESVFTWT